MKKTALVIAAGFLLSGVGLTSASGAPVIEGASASSYSTSAQADGHHRHCSHYPGSVYTSTTLHLFKHRVPRNERNTAVVHVRSVGRADPRGTVRLTIRRNDHRVRQLIRPVENGTATFHLLRHLKPGHYKVKAWYTPKRCSKWTASSSETQHLTVTKRRHHHHHHHHHR